MSTMTTLPWGRALTEDDLAAMPDDGHRYELVDGTLIVSPSPSMWHQRASTRLVTLLARACPADLEVFHAPLDVRLANDTVMQPDLLVARQADLVPTGLRTAPLLAVEIASPSTHLVDRNLKMVRFAAAGCPHFWIVDPRAPSITAWHLVAGAYVQAGHAEEFETLTLTAPFPVRVTPAELVSG